MTHHQNSHIDTHQMQKESVSPMCKTLGALTSTMHAIQYENVSHRIFAQVGEYHLEAELRLYKQILENRDIIRY